MVAVSMGILYHRLSAPQTRESNESYEGTLGQRDFEFVSLSNQKPESAEQRAKLRNTLGAEIHKEIEKKLNDEDKENLELVHQLLEDSTTLDGDDANDGEEKPQQLEVPESIQKQLSQLNDEEDLVFTDQNNEQIMQQNEDFRQPQDHDPKIGNNDDNHDDPKSDPKNYVSSEVSNETSNEPNIDQEGEELENIPEKENADQSFKNVKGILRQQESIRRAILKTQRKSKKVPPPVKPKPKLSTGTARISQVITQNSVVKKYTSLESLTLNELQSYQEQLEGEKTAILKCTKSMSSVVKEAKEHLSADRTSGENTLSELEYTTVVNDLERLQSQLMVVEKQLRDVQKYITRKVASKGLVAGSPPRTRNGRSTPDPTNRVRSGSLNSEISYGNNQLRESRGRQDIDDEHVDSIII